MNNENVNKYKEKYSKFIDDCYDNGKNLVDEMYNEIERLIVETKQGNENVQNSTEKIMALILETRYEW